MFSHPPFSSWCRRAGAVLCVAALAACGGSGHKKEASSKPQDVVVPGSNVTLRLVAVNVESPGGPVTIDQKTRTAVMNQTREYVANAIVKPMMSGKKAAAYATLFAPNVLAGALGKDRAALTDDAVGKVSNGVKATTTKVGLTGLADSSGNVLYISANFNLNLSVKVRSTPVAIKRNTELVFERAPNGTWLISSYRVIATRDVRGASSSAAATSTTGKP